MLEGPDQLIDWGLKSARSDANAESLAKIERLIDFYRPQIVAIEKVSANGSRRCQRVRQLLNKITDLATQRRIRVRRVRRADVRKVFSGTGATTKYRIATAITQRFPELMPSLPAPRKIWMSEDSRMRIFGALALASLDHFRSSAPTEVKRS